MLVWYLLCARKLILCVCLSLPWQPQRHGHGVMKYSESSSYNGDWCYGIRHGQGEFVMSDGTVYRGQWVDNKFNGKGTLSIGHISYTYNGKYISLC